MNKFSLIFLFLVIIIQSCVQKSQEGLDNIKVQKQYGGHLRLSLSDVPVSFDPIRGVDVNSADIITQIHDGLVRFSPSDLEINPSIAEKWAVSEDGKIYTFYLRKDVYFHDNSCFEGGKGRNVKASDVEYSLYRACTFQKNNMVFSQTLRGKILGADAYYQASKKGDFSKKIEGIHVGGDYTITLTLSQPDYGFLSILAMPALSVVPKEAIEKYADQSMVGCGAFELLINSSEMKNEFLLKRNMSYYRSDSIGNKLPFLDSVTFTVAVSRRFEMEEFKKRNLEMVWGVPKESVDALVEGNIEKFQNDSMYRLRRIPEYTTQYYIFNTGKKIFQDVRVRKAISLAIDKQKLVDEVLKGEAFAPGVYGIVHPSMKNYDITKVKGLEYNPTEAKKLLAEAGYPEGKNFPTIQLKINNDGRKNIPVAVEVSKQLERNLGIRMNMDMVSLSEKLADEYQGNSDMYRSAWTADYPMPESFLGLFYSAPDDYGDASFPNTSRFKDKEFDEKYKKALMIAASQDRNLVLAEAEQILVNKAPFIPVYYEENYVLTQSYVHDMYFNSLKYKDLSIVFIKK